MKWFGKQHTTPVLLAVISTIIYGYFAFFLDRSEFPKLFGLFALLFIAYYLILSHKTHDLKLLLGVGIVSRLVFSIATPNLSQDFYRFIWDGESLLQGINPYLFTPQQLVQAKAVTFEFWPVLYHNMGELSATHFSNYPPINQFFFVIATWLGGSSLLGKIIVFRCILLSADIGILYFGRKLLIHFKKPPHLIFWFFLNPLVIIEGVGNLHFESVMIFFFVWAIYLLQQHKIKWGAILYALSISTKLIPLLFLPAFLRYYNWKKVVLFYGIIGSAVLLLFLPFFSLTFVQNYQETVGLWFSNFEFNASLYNLIKHLSSHYYEYPTWKLIREYGAISPILIATTLCCIALFNKQKSLQQWMQTALWILVTYFLFSTTVHPWYLIFVVFLSVFSSYKFGIIWSFMITLSYYAYSNPTFTESKTLLLLEYLIVIGYIIYEKLNFIKPKLAIPKK